MTSPSAPTDALEARLTAIERRLQAVEQRHNGLLVGWAAISRAVGKRPRTCMNYVRWGFPALRFGRHRVSSQAMIDSWLLSIEQGKLSGAIPRYRSRMR
jgi:hypothetical protein